MRTTVHYGPATTYTWLDGQQTTMYRCTGLETMPAQFVADVLSGEFQSLTSPVFSREIRECLDTQYNPRHVPAIPVTFEFCYFHALPVEGVPAYIFLDMYVGINPCEHYCWESEL